MMSGRTMAARDKAAVREVTGPRAGLVLLAPATTVLLVFFAYPLATIVFNGRVVGVWEWNEDDEEVDSLLFDSSIPKSVEKSIHKRAGELANFIRANLGEVRLQGSDYGPHQMTGIHDLKAFWGKGAHVDVRV